MQTEGRHTCHIFIYSWSSGLAWKTDDTLLAFRSSINADFRVISVKSIACSRILNARFRNSLAVPVSWWSYTLLATCAKPYLRIIRALNIHEPFTWLDISLISLEWLSYHGRLSVSAVLFSARNSRINSKRDGAVYSYSRRSSELLLCRTSLNEKCGADIACIYLNRL